MVTGKIITGTNKVISRVPESPLEEELIFEEEVTWVTFMSYQYGLRSNLLMRPSQI